MQKYTNNVADAAGNAIVAATIVVTLLGGAAATIYSDNGVTAVSSTLTADDKGVFSFYAANGHYTLSISGAGIAPFVISDILLEDYDAQIVALNASITMLTASVVALQAASGGSGFEVTTNKSTSPSLGVSDILYPSQKAVKTYVDATNSGQLNDRGNYDASVNVFPSTGGSGAAGAILKGDIWYISVGGTLGGVAVVVGSSVRALSAAPGQTAANWSILATGLGYTPENSANKNASGGYAGLTVFDINHKNVAGTVTSKHTNTATAARTWTYPDKTGTVAMTSDIPAYAGTAKRIGTPAWAVSMTLDWSNFDLIRIVMGGNTALTHSAAVDGQDCFLELTQDNTGSRTMTDSANVQYSVGLPKPTLSVSGNTTDAFWFRRQLTTDKYMALGFQRGFGGATGPQLYVATTGNDANAGTFALPFASIAKAATVATAGTTINVASGSYQGSIFVTTGAGTSTAVQAFGVANGTSSLPITIKSTVQGGAAIKPLAATGLGSGSGNTAGIEIRANWWVIDGFEIDGSAGYTGAGTTWTIGGNEWNYCIYLTGSNCTAIRNHCHDVCRSATATASGGAGIEAEYFYGGSAATIDSNKIHHIGTAPGSNTTVHGVYIATGGCLVQNNLIYQNASDGITSWHAADALTVINNTSFSNGTGILLGSGNAGAVAGGIKNSTFSNNISYNNVNGGFVANGAAGAGNVFDHNLSFLNGGNGNWFLNNTGTTLTHTNDTTADPAFVNFLSSGAGDYHLQVTSPARNTGVNASAPALDFDGVVRPQGVTVDLGCYERA
jgi:hypothetical protein